MNNRYVALDFEVMDTWRAAVCSVGCAVFENGKLVETFYSLVRPPSKNENYYCVKTHGLTYEDVKDAPAFDVVWEKVDRLIGNSPVVAHNAAFEKSCIDACSEEFGTKNDYVYIDTLKMSRRLLTESKKHTLIEACGRVGIRIKRYHNALDDAIACGKLFSELSCLDNIKKEKQNGQERTN